MGVDERGTIAGAAVVGGAPESGVGDDGIGAVNFFEMEIGEAGDQARDVAAGGLHFDRNRDRVLVVLHAEDHGQAAVGGGVQRLPEFAFAGGAVAERDVGDFVALELDVLELAVIAFGFLRGVGMLGEIASGFGASDGLQNLGAGGGRLGDDVEPLESPVRGHLAAAGTGIVGRADGAEQHFVGSRAQGEAERAVAIVRIEPVVAGFNAKAAATPTASWPAPEIWKKIFCWRLSRISRSSRRREVNMMR